MIMPNEEGPEGVFCKGTVLIGTGGQTLRKTDSLSLLPGQMTTQLLPERVNSKHMQNSFGN